MNKTEASAPLTIPLEGDNWRILGQGAVREGEVFCHLASTTRFTQQRNGAVPVQIGTWVDANLILSAAMQREESLRANITSYYTDRANGQHAAKAP